MAYIFIGTILSSSMYCGCNLVMGEWFSFLVVHDGSLVGIVNLIFENFFKVLHYNCVAKLNMMIPQFCIFAFRRLFFLFEKLLLARIHNVGALIDVFFSVCNLENILLWKNITLIVALKRAWKKIQVNLNCKRKLCIEIIWDNNYQISKVQSIAIHFMYCI